ncbi:MAG: response regulator transcription factor [Saprospiraceae bacterium]|nr:response regulator transcription factor [Saprospiraceae bacterium]
MTKQLWNAAVFEREKQDSDQFISLINRLSPEVNIRYTSFLLNDALECIQKPDLNLAFCNVHLLDGNIFEVLEQVGEPGFPLVFLAPDEHYALRAFRYHAFDYLIKPVSEKGLLDLMERLDVRSPLRELKPSRGADSAQQMKFNTIILKTAGMQHIVQVSDIVHLEGDGNYSTVNLISGEKIVVAKPLKHFEDILPARFFYRVHQSHIINLQYVKSVQNGDVQLIHLTNGDTAPLARRKKDPFLTWLDRHYLQM